MIRKITLFASLVFAFTAIMAQTATLVNLNGLETKVALQSVNQDNIQLQSTLQQLIVEPVATEAGNFVNLNFEGMQPSVNTGKPSLPLMTRLIEIPHGATPVVNILSYDEQIIDLDNYSFPKIAPAQPSYSKSTQPDDIVFEYNTAFYAINQFNSDALVEVEIGGIMRGVRLATLKICPFHYNPVENTLKVYNNLQFEVVFENADYLTTEAMKEQYFSPNFQPALAQVINYQAPAAKDTYTQFPIKYVIVANRAFETTLQPFITWKRKSGYNVIEAYTDVVGSTNTAIKTYLQGLYTAGTPGDPAPTYVLIIGDHSGTYSIPAFASTASTPSSSHITDVYFGCYDGASDFIPDVYMGRISAESTTELQNALNKIVPYEMYTFGDGSYLNKAMLIAGVDNNYAKSHGDATILYGINYYYNTGNDYSNIYAYYHTYTSGPYHVMASNSTAADADVRSRFTEGIGFANYTAHCSHDGWADPTVNRSHIANFNNQNKYPFMIGNCCLSFQFNQSDAFGEMLLYTANEGAVGYIGASNSSYWNEDVYWGIGLTSISITEANVPNHTYANTGQGVYDGVWHSHGESFDEWFFTAGQINLCGNLQVQASTSTYKKYYWEIYHVVGDPSLMPYNTEPDALSISYPALNIGNNSLTVTTEPYTYVAISQNGVLWDAKWTGSGTTATLNFATITGSTPVDIVATKQEKIPHIASLTPMAAEPPTANFSGTPTTILEGQSVSFTDLSQYAASWLWNFGDGQTSTEQHPVHVYTSAGQYTVSLTVANPIDSDTEVKTNYITVNVNTNPPVADFTANTTTVNIGGSVNFTDLTENNPTAWAWSFEGGTPDNSDVQNPTGIVYNTPGSYTVTLTATNPYGPDGETKIGYITVSLPEYCDAYGENITQLYITNVTMNTINNNSGAQQYSDFTAISTDVILGDTYGFSVGLSGSFSRNQCLIWADWNRDGDFEDTGEAVYVSTIGAATGYTGNISIPSNAGTGPVRIRVRQHYNETGYTPNTTPCGASGFGEVEDYTLNLISPDIPPTADFTSDVTSTCTGIVQFNDLSLLAESWEWDFGDGTSSTEQNPQHTYTSNGVFTVSLTAFNSNGSDTHSMSNYITVNMPEAPTTTSAEACGPASLSLSASGNSPLVWYNTATGGSSIHTGSTYTATFSESATLYVQSGETPAYYSGGNTNIATNGGNHTSNAYYMVFTAHRDFTLQSVEVNASTAGSRTFVLVNSSNVQIATHTQYLDVGINVVNFNFEVLQGADYELRCNTGTPNLWRNNAGVSYPYNISDVVSITGSTAGDEYYYYYYNWQIMTGDECISARTPVEAVINDLPAAVSVAGGGVTCGGSATLTASGGTGGTIYWQGTTSGGTSTATASTSQTVTSSGTYYFRARSANGCWGPEGSATVTINAVPGAVSVTGGGTQCGGSITLSATGGTGGTIYWQGTTSGGTSTATPSISQTVNTSGTYYFRARSAEACWGPEGSATVTINPVPDAVVVNGGGTQCGGTITLTASGGTGGTIYWQGTTSGGTSTATASSSQTVSTSGTYYFRARSAEGCWGPEGSATVAINPVPTAVVVSGGGTQCGGIVDLNASGGSGGTIYWQGTTSGGTSTVTPTTAQSVTESGTYYFRARSADGCWGPEGSATVVINTVPGTVTVSGGGLYCGNAATLTASGGTNGTIYWQGTTGGGTSTATASSSQTVTSSGTYYFRARSAEGCWGPEGSATVTISPAVLLSMSMTQESTPGAADGSITASVTGGTAPYNYTWIPSLTGNPVMGVSAGFYCVTVVDQAGCSASGCITVTVANQPNPPVAQFTSNTQSGCGSLIVQFTDQSTNNPTEWLWDFGDGNTSTEQSPLHTYDAPGQYTVSLTVSNADGEDVAETEAYITVWQNPTIELSMTPASNESASDGSVTANAGGGSSPYLYEWSNGALGANLIDVTPGDYCVTVYDSNACSVTACIEVTVNTGDPLPVASFSMSVASGCTPLSVLFTDESTNTPTSWSWNFGDGNYSSEQNPTHTYATPGIYTVELTVENTAGSNSYVWGSAVEVYEIPEITVDVTNASGETVADGSAIINITGGSAPYSILWSNNATDNSIENMLPGNYSVLVVDANGCIATSPVYIGWNVSVAPVVVAGIKVHPNPSDTYIMVESTGFVASNIEITDVLGKTILKTKATANITRIDVSDLNAGIYFVSTTSNNKKFVQKIIVK